MEGTLAPGRLLGFRLAGIPVEVRPLYLLVVLGGALTSRTVETGALWVAAVTASILWHELGHGLAMRAFGFPPRIELYAFGGLTHWPPEASPGARQALLVSLAGPGAGLLLGGAVWLLARWAGPLPWLGEVAVRYLLWVNVFWSLVNLLPIMPLDGSHVLDEVSRLSRGAVRPGWVGWASALAGGTLAALAASRQQPWLAFLGIRNGSGPGAGPGADRAAGT